MASNQISNLVNLVKLGWVDFKGNPLDWKYWQRQRRVSYWVWEEVDESELEDVPKHRRGILKAVQKLRMRLMGAEKQGKYDGLQPLKISQFGRVLVETYQDYRVLWLAVIKRAQEEAEGRYIYWDEDVKLIKYHARKWLTRLSPSLCEVCSLAGFTPEMTQRLVEDGRKKYGR